MKFLHLLLITLAFFFLITGCSSNKEVKEGERLTDQEMLQSGHNQFTATQYEQAIDTYKSLIMDYPTSDLHIQAQLQIAAAYGQLEDYESQMDALLTLLKENIIPQEVPQIYLQVGKFYEQAAHFNPGTISSDTTDYKTALQYYKKAYTYKDSDDQNSKAASAYRRALVHAKIGAIDEAIALYKIVGDFFPESNHAVLAAVKLRNPQDTSELPLDPVSIEALRQELNIPVTQPETEAVTLPEPTPEQQEVMVEETGLDESVFDPSLSDTTGLNEDYEEALPDSGVVE